MIRDRLVTFSAGLALLGLLVAPASAFAQDTGRPDGQRFIPDVYGQFRALTGLAEPLGLHISTTPNPSACRHYQGVARLDGADGTPFFWVTRSGNLPNFFLSGLICDDSPGERYNGNLVVFRMGSRDKNGERLRSNRLKKGVHVNNTEPPDEDVATIYFTVVGGDDPHDPDPCMRPGLLFREGFVDANEDGQNDCSSPPPHAYQHPGGMQRIGHVLAMAMDTPRDLLTECKASCAVQQPPFDAACRAHCDETVHYEKASSRSRIMFFDVTSPEEPVFLSQFTPFDGQDNVLHDADALAITALPNGRYLMATSGGFEGDEPIYFYRSTSTDLTSPDLSWELVDRDFDMNDEDEDAHQSFHFFREGGIDGPLFLAGSRGHPAFGADHDKLDLMEVHSTDPEFAPGSVITHTVRYRGQPQGTFPSTGGNRLANLAAATGFYESPSGELIFYATEHDNDGPNETVKMGEWRHKDMAREGSPTFQPSIDVNGPYEVNEGGSLAVGGSAGPPATRAFIQLFDDPDFEGSYPVVDFDDVDKDDFDDFATLEYVFFSPIEIRFNNRATSWKWYAPVGCSIQVTDKATGDTATLAGTGAVVSEADLRNVSNDTGTGDMNDMVDAVRFLGDCTSYYSTPVTLTWDLNGDGTFETTGANPTFDATLLDGPGTIVVPAQAQHPFGGAVTSSTAIVNVRNVPPALSLFELADAECNVVNVDIPFVLTNVSMKAHGLFADPGVLDTQSASLDWGDGVVETDCDFSLFDQALGDGAGEAESWHRYTLPGTYSIALTVTDDDGGTGSASASVRVVTPEQAVIEIIDALDDLIAQATGSALKDLLKAHKALAGSTDTSNNGALAHIQAGHNAAAIAAIKNAIKWLQKSGVDADDLIAQLQATSTSLAQ